MIEEGTEKFTTRNVVYPHGIVQVIRDHWWWCVDGNPEKAVIYVGHNGKANAPQCNTNESLARRIRPPVEGIELVQIPVAFMLWER